MKNIFLTAIFGLLFITSSVAQDFDSAVGLRLGYPASVTYKKFISDANAIEAYAGFRNWIGANFINLSGAYQIHKDIDEVDGLQYYYGGGASVYLWSFDFGESQTSFGVQGYLGLSYTLEDTPINVSLDVIPTFFINGASGFANGFGANYGALAVRYVLGRGDNP